MQHPKRSRVVLVETFFCNRRKYSRWRYWRARVKMWNLFQPKRQRSPPNPVSVKEPYFKTWLCRQLKPACPRDWPWCRARERQGRSDFRLKLIKFKTEKVRTEKTYVARCNYLGILTNRLNHATKTISFKDNGYLFLLTKLIYVDPGFWGFGVLGGFI